MKPFMPRVLSLNQTVERIRKNIRQRSILKIMNNILNNSYINHFGITTPLLQDFLTSAREYTPYTLEWHDRRIYDAEKSMKNITKPLIGVK
jgi:hypothetical protein